MRANLFFGHLLSITMGLTMLPILLTRAGHTQNCDANALILAIEKFKDNQKSCKAAKATLEQCGEESGQKLKAQVDTLEGWRIREIQNLQGLVKKLDTALLILENNKTNWSTKADNLKALRLARNGLQKQLSRLIAQPLDQSLMWVRNNSWIGLLVAYVVSYGGVFALRPLWLLKAGEIQAAVVSTWPKVAGIPIDIGLKLLLPGKYHPRVLDAWVAERISKVRQQLLEHRGTVTAREIHIAQPVFWDSNPEPIEFQSKAFAELFADGFQLVIWGEGGSGKTSLACQLARWAMWGSTSARKDQKELVKKLCKHRMLPILIEAELEQSSLLTAISAQLKDLAKETIPPELLKHLLQERRVLVIVDHLSEMSESTRKKIRPTRDEKFPANALIVTSRHKDILGSEASPTFVQPSRITVKRLASFLNAYLLEKQKREGVALDFDGEDYSKAYSHLESMISLRQALKKQHGQQQGATILLVTLYANQMIFQKQKQKMFNENALLPQSNLPTNIPDLMLAYLDSLSENVSQTFPEFLKPDKFHEVAQLVAWKCLEKTFKPESNVSTDEVVKALALLERRTGAENPVEQANQHLKYLEQHLSLIQIRKPDLKTLRFSLDPLAEYLAALHLLWTYRDDLTAWKDFLQEVDRKSTDLDEIQGFLLALYDCCDKKGQGQVVQIPSEVVNALVRFTKLDEDAVEAYQSRRRMRLALSYLEDRNPRYRLRALKDLTEMGKAAIPTIPQLSEVLADQGEDLDVRLQVLEVLKHIATETASVVVESLPELLLKLLNDKREFARVRQETGKILRGIGKPLPLLVYEIRADVELLDLIETPPEQVVQLSEWVALELVRIPAGEFWMGSRDAEADSSESPRHRVKMPSFWMGRYPVTQAQWRKVANLPKVKIDLEPEASRFKGNDRPVERISWYQAVEFCDRLSQNTGQVYRLPSEAEWEYACRARTETPYHFGEEIRENLANFSGRHASNETTTVGWYGVANVFGLYDMHGNVFECCADHWHENYEGAPIDGSAWITVGSDSGRILRGGSWKSNPRSCRSACRNRYNSNYSGRYVGFRVVCASPRAL